MSKGIEIEPSVGCRVCGKDDESKYATAYVLCHEHRRLANAAPAMLAALERLVAEVSPDLYRVAAADRGRRANIDDAFAEARAAIASVKGETK